MAKPRDGVGAENYKKHGTAALQELDDYITDPKNPVKQFIHDITRRVKAANDESKQLKELFEKENQAMQRRLTECEKVRERYRKERNDLKTQLENFSREAKQTVAFEKEKQLRREIEELQNLFQQKNNEWERKFKESEDSSNEIIRVQRQKIEEYEQDIKRQKQKVKYLDKLMEENKFSFSDTGKLQKRLEETERRLNDTNDKLSRVSLKLQETEKELEDTRTRLSKSMGDNLTDNNPNIADLSDKNRPTKLAEKYAELYDNQWTDAFEQIQIEVYTTDDKQIITILLGILLNISDFCNQRANRQMEDLKRALLCSDSTVYGSVPDNITKQLKDCRKATSLASKDHVLELYLSSLRSETGQLRHALKIKSFVKECIEICWLMANQDPPVVFGPAVKRGEVLNTDAFKAYLKNGPYVDFIVWPVMLLYNGGPVLAKGVAQGFGDKIRGSKECWVEENENISDRSRFAITSAQYVQDTGHGYDRSKGSYIRSPVSTVYDCHNKTYALQEDPRSGEYTYPRKESYLANSRDTEPTTTYEREPSSEEMNRFFRYYNRSDYIGARNVLGVKVYERCRKIARLKFNYY